MRIICGFIMLAWCLSNFSCSSSHQIAGHNIVSAGKDSVWAKKKISQIRQLPNSVFDTASFVDSAAQIIRYRFFTPERTNQALPLVLVFHGSGAIGNDNNSQLGILAKLFAQDSQQQQHPCCILAPQFATRSADYFWDSTQHALSSKARPCLQSVLHLVDSLKELPGIDKHRIYVIGFSMGGSTVMNALALRPDLFAAGISIAGIPNLQSQVTKTPVWLIHGNKDTDNGIESDQDFYLQMKKKRPIRFTELDEMGHDDIFESFIVGNALPDWLFRHHK